ncbi:peptidoglycan recognition family protein [Lysinibacter sp. HNR]|uniref:N-acetylmuramoyl-L-alanine amidase n=1 Tax=Lysinibacter sp. HNR TaxID=3031408 RepID=UPI002434B6DE|nr:peptidoglycan recognition family protein [Lysinibacter sp. HNR]WGD36833.1 peptidoglycan recognition family protein [Lysinibacter sp. HNR]
MVFSHLATRTAPSQKHSTRTKSISRMIVHHTAGGTNEGNIALLSTDARQVSANYCLLTTGQLVGIVPEERRAWTSGSDAADSPSITIETVNTGGEAAGWPVSDVQIEMLAHLAADLSTRYQWGPLDRNRIIGHRQVAATACPGPYLYPRLEQIVTRANYILHNTGTTPAIPGIGDREMIRIQSPGRGFAIIGAGYVRQLTTQEEVENAEALVTRRLVGSDREFDLWVSIANGGKSAAS